MASSNPNATSIKRQQARNKNARQVNIPRSVTDAFYRYKMPEMLPKVEGRGNGIKTVIVNMSDIAKALQRPPSYITKFFGYEFGAISTIDEANDRFVVNGNHDPSQLNSGLDNFIARFCLCKKCQLPETSMKISRGAIELRCNACGEATTVHATDRIGSFILKNPPTSTKTKGSADRPESKAKVAHAEHTVEIVAPAAPANAEVEWFADTDAESVRHRREELLGQMNSVKAAELFAVGAKAAEDQQAQAQLHAKSPTPDARSPSPAMSPPPMDIDEALEQIADEDRLVSDEAAAKAVEELRPVPARYRVHESEVVCKLFPLLFGEDIRRQVALKAPLLKALTERSAEAQMAVLQCLTELCERCPGVIATLADILNGMYQLEVIEEDAVTQWGEALSARIGTADKPNEKLFLGKMCLAAKPFIEWLKTAEEEESDEA
eukprot:TRINITY_DN6529_c0_g1_i1.p1 TRINITY_DN6529_c0_g1~~TRINITY_DN6529_c0_g1_i1.p1  ORF type:complete len:436 (+),score=122.89 TRINITY_DN6529_c0_g1_i1:146-1453(+)